jgi:hypothetical protein
VGRRPEEMAFDWTGSCLEGQAAEETLPGKVRVGCLELFNSGVPRYLSSVSLGTMYRAVRGSSLCPQPAKLPLRPTSSSSFSFLPQGIFVVLHYEKWIQCLCLCILRS